MCIIAVLGSNVNAQDSTAPGYNRVRDEGTNLTRRRNLNMVGAGVSCADDSSNGETDCTISGGGSGNSFETLDVPAGTDPVADSSTDTLTITETTTPLVITGTAATDTIDITWTTLGADQGGTGATSLTDGGILLGSGTGAITALGVATNGQFPIGDGTTDPVLATLTESTALDVANGAGTITLSWDSTEVEATTWGAGGNASNLWTFNLSGTDPTLNWVSGGATLVGTFTADALTLGAEENLTLGSSTIQEDTTTTDVTINNDVDIEDATPHLRLTDTTASSRDFEFWADGDQLYFTDVTNGTVLLRFNSLNQFFLRGGSTNYAWPTTDGTNGQFLTTNGSGFMTWTTSSGSGDITSVGDCTTGACFDGSTGTTLTFEGDGGANFTFLYDATTDDDFELSDDLTIEDATPHLRLTDTTAASDDFEIYADGNQVYLTNVTDGKELIRFNSIYELFIPSGDVYITNDVFTSANIDGVDFLWDETNDQLIVGDGPVHSGLAGTTPGIFATSEGGTDPTILMQSENNGTPAFILAGHGGVLASPSIIANATSMNVEFFGYDGADWREFSRLGAFVDGAPGVGDMPGAIGFSTASDGTSTLTRRFLVDNDGNITVGQTNLALAHLAVDGDEDEIQFLVQGFSTQTTNLVVFENSAGTDLFQFLNVGDAVFGGDLDLEDDTPHMRLTDTDTASDDFEIYVDGNQTYWTNVTDGIQLIRFNSNYDFFFRGTGVNYAWPTSDGTNGQFLTTNASGGLSWTTSSGSGDVTDVWSCATGDCNQPVIATGEFLDGGTATVDGTSEGILLPRATDTSTATSEGQIGWETGNDFMTVGTGTEAIPVGWFIVAGGDVGGRTVSFVAGYPMDNTAIGSTLIPADIVCRRLQASVDVAPGAGNSWAVSVRDDGVDTALTCTISETNTSCVDNTNVTVEIASGSDLDANYVEGGTATSTAGAQWSMICRIASNY